MKEFILTNYQWLIITFILPLVSWFGAKKQVHKQNLKRTDTQIWADNFELQNKIFEETYQRYKSMQSSYEDDLKHLQAQLEVFQKERRKWFSEKVAIKRKYREAEIRIETLENALRELKHE